MDLLVSSVDRTTVEVPFREVPERNMLRQNPEWKYFDIFEVELESGHVGIGETMLYYGWGETDDDDVNRAVGEDAAQLLWDDSLGGLQIALFDAVGKAMGVPIHALFGERVRETVPLSWWCIDMPAEDFIVECREAIDRGYTSVKLKGRPWFDVRADIERLCETLPTWFTVQIDFNGTLLDDDRAIPILRELDRHEQVTAFESPIPQDDLEGNLAIRDAVDADLVMHNGRPASLSMLTQLCVELCDGFVLGTGGANQLRDEGTICAMADKPCFLQQVGTGITAAFSIHLGGTLEQARWPGVNCHTLYDHPLLNEPITVEDGRASVPTEPGLGYTLDRAAVERFRVEKPSSRPSPPRLVETRWNDGRKTYFATESVTDLAASGELPYYQRGVSTRVVPDDGSDEWESLHERALEEPVWVHEGDDGL